MKNLENKLTAEKRKIKKSLRDFFPYWGLKNYTNKLPESGLGSEEGYGSPYQDAVISSHIILIPLSVIGLGYLAYKLLTYS